MRTEWVCTWSLIPVSEKYVEKYSSEREAKTAMAQRIVEYFDLKPYLNRMHKEKDPDYKEAADYLEKFLSCLSFEECAEYSMPGLSGLVECYGYEDEFSWSCNYQHCPFFSARESSCDDEPGLFIGFCYQNPPKVKTPQVTGINIHIVERIDYGGSAEGVLAEEDAPFVSVEEMPKFQGGDFSKFSKWVQKNCQYPVMAQETGIQGSVLLQLVVEKDGRVSVVEVLNSPDKLLTDEALRVIKKSPKFTPGKQRGVPVRVQFVLPVRFKL